MKASKVVALFGLIFQVGVAANADILIKVHVGDLTNVVPAHGRIAVSTYPDRRPLFHEAVRWDADTQTANVLITTRRLRGTTQIYYQLFDFRARERRKKCTAAPVAENATYDIPGGLHQIDEVVNMVCKDK